jgi:hypothetical protein
MIQLMHETSFDWLTWRNGSLIQSLNIQHNKEVIKSNSHIIRRYAVGYCKADNIVCRPKKGYIAVMFLTDDYWWTHLLVEEFNYCFKEKELKHIQRKQI